METARIEVYSKSVGNLPTIPFKGDAQHLFIVYVDSAGNKIALRGGPEENNFIGALQGDVKITMSPYNDKHVDWDKSARHIEIARGTDVEMQALVDKMWGHAQQINKEGFDYKLPFIGHIQNSNTAVSEMVKAAGLELKLPLHHSGKNVWAPGINGHFTHTFLDTYTDKDAANVLSSTEYERVVSSDFTQISYVNKQTGSTIYIENTDARKVGSSTLVSGVSEEEVAALYNVPVDRVSENFLMNQDVLGRPNGQNIFIITPAESNKKVEDPVISILDGHTIITPQLLVLQGLVRERKKYIEEDIARKINSEVDSKSKALSAESDAKFNTLLAAAKSECDARAEVAKASIKCDESKSCHRDDVYCQDIMLKYDQEFENYKTEQAKQFEHWHNEFLAEQDRIYQEQMHHLTEEARSMYDMRYGYKPFSLENEVNMLNAEDSSSH